MKHKEREGMKTGVKTVKNPTATASVHASPAIAIPTSANASVTLELSSCVHANNVLIAEVDELSASYEKGLAGQATIRFHCAGMASSIPDGLGSPSTRTWIGKQP